jgi:pilus assembly protein CpaF
MFLLTLKSAENAPSSLVHKALRCVIGKDGSSDVKLTGWRVSKQHAEIFVSNDNIYIRDLNSSFGTFVNAKRVNTFGPLAPKDEIKVGDFAIHVAMQAREDKHVHTSSNVQVNPQNINRQQSNESSNAVRLSKPDQQVSVQQAAIDLKPNTITAHAEKTATENAPVVNQELLKWRRIVHEKLLESFDLKRTDVHRMSDVDLRRHTQESIEDILQGLKELPSSINKNQLMAEVRDEAIGLGLLEPLLADNSITEIMVNRSDEIFVERGGRLERCHTAFTSDRAVLGVIERIVAPIGRRIDESSPMVDARLKDGSRVNAVIAPLALKGPSLTIRKFSKKKLVADDLRKFGSANQPMLEFLQVAVEQRKNIVISGGTGSGKTTLLNIMGNFIPNGERIVTVEDAAELQLRHEHLVSLESRPVNLEGKGQISIRDLVRNCLRMRPDRIVVGECRGGEALDMLQAMNTGHDGSMTTAHANTPRDMLARLEVMVLMAGMDLPVTAIREQVASAVDIVVQISRYPCGSRKITHITEITGSESGKIQMQDLFLFIQTGMDENQKTKGYFTGCGSVPEFYEQLGAFGIKTDLSIFSKIDVNGIISE